VIELPLLLLFLLLLFLLFLFFFSSFCSLPPHLHTSIIRTHLIHHLKLLISYSIGRRAEV
jgi:hypothetical protein